VGHYRADHHDAVRSGHEDRYYAPLTIDEVYAKAMARGLQDSQMVEELLWLALAVVEEAR